MSQVPFVTICEEGHLGDFPFREWAHRDINPTCQGRLQLRSSGGGSLSKQTVSCESCDAYRSLRSITETRPHPKDPGQTTTFLTMELQKGAEYACRGEMPWLALAGNGCGHPMRAALRGAGNVYYPKVSSSIYLPQTEHGADPALLKILEDPQCRGILDNYFVLHDKPLTTETLKKLKLAHDVSTYTNEQLQAGLDEYFGTADTPDTMLAPAYDDDEREHTMTDAWRHPEFLQLRANLDDEDLTGRNPGVPTQLAAVLGRVRQVETLRETRVLRGFTRVKDSPLKLHEGKEQLRRNAPKCGKDWLPAYVVRGEGLYLEMNSDRLAEWENRPEVQERANVLQTNLTNSYRGTQGRDISPRFVLVHTFAHLIMNRLVYSCGYSSASLRERLYVSTASETPMAAMLIYTAAGDSEGTMGGLVRMGKPENLQRVVSDTIATSRWCSADPVCMEIGDLGQGPESCNLAACHGCTLTPETSCEEFNKFLDRGLLIGTFNDPTLGYFANPTTGGCQENDS